jgi:hypothetical protein
MGASILGRTLASALALVLAVAVAPASSAKGGGGGGSGGSTASITGTVYTIDTARRNITVKTSVGTSVKLSVGRSTAITRNGASVTLKGLALNDSVTATYRVSNLAAKAVSASGPSVTSVSGKASAVSFAGGGLTLGSQNLQTNAGTRIARNGKIVALRQITSRDTLVAHVAAGTNVALDVLADGPDESEVQGAISMISGSNVTITPDDGSPPVTVVVGTATIIEVNDAPGTLADLQVTQAVEAEYDPTTFAAFSIDVSSESEDAEVEGTVFAVDTTLGTVTITPQGGGPAIVLTVNASTEIEVNGDGGTLADIQMGMPISAEYNATTLLATQIEAGGSDDSEGNDNSQGTDN